MIDSHCHLEFDHFNGEREKVIITAKNRLKGIVDSSANINHAQDVLKLHEDHPNFIFPSLGLHPKEAVQASKEEIEEFKNMARNEKDKIVAIGEVGLDYYHVKNNEKRDRSKEVFEEMIKLSNSLELPLVVHSRNSLEDALKILEDKNGDVIIHCFAGSEEELEECIDRNYYLSFGGIIFRSKNKYRPLLKKTPLENLLLETDAPFLAKSKKDRSEPWLIREIANEIAEIKGVDFNEVWEKAGKNAKNVFSLPISLK